MNNKELQIEVTNTLFKKGYLIWKKDPYNGQRICNNNGHIWSIMSQCLFDKIDLNKELITPEMIKWWFDKGHKTYKFNYGEKPKKRDST